MRNIEIVQAALDYIEKNLKEEINLNNVAAMYNFSNYHFHRIFLSIVGTTVNEYIKRRKLDLAAKELIYTEKPIIDIALDCGYESEQAFCRSFKKEYGMPPGRYRKQNIYNEHFKKFDMSDKIKMYGRSGIGMEPKIVDKDSFFIVGVEGYTGDGFSIIGECWEELKAHMNEIKDIINNDICFGYEDYSKDFVPETLKFYYIAGVEVRSLDDIPKGMVGKNIPASKYAVFTYKGNNSDGGIGKLFRYIYDEWFPQSGYQMSEDVCGDFEYYDSRWDMSSPNCEMDIYIPIK